MSPNDSRQQPLPPASLPALPLQPLALASQQTAPSSNPLQPALAAPALVQPGTASLEEAVERAKQLVEQGQTPYQLAESFAQLKADYLARQYHITSNPAGS